MKIKNESGFTLIELVVIIVIVGITLPLIIMPLVNAAGAAASPGDIAMLASVNRGNMEKEIAETVINWPLALDIDFSTNSFSETIDGRQYTTTVERMYVDALFAPTDGNPVNGSDFYMLLSVTTTDSSGYTLNLQTLRGRPS